VAIAVARWGSWRVEVVEIEDERASSPGVHGERLGRGVAPVVPQRGRLRDRVAGQHDDRPHAPMRASSMPS